MSDTIVELRDKYIYVKFKNLKSGDLAAAGDEVVAHLEADAQLGILVDDTEVQYKDLTPTIKLEAVKVIARVKQSPKIIVVVDERDDKLRYFASFAITTIRISSVKVVTSMDEAIKWLTTEDKKLK